MYHWFVFSVQAEEIITVIYWYGSLTQQITFSASKYWLHVSAVNSHLQAKFYITLVDLHNEYLLTMWSHVALQYLVAYIMVAALRYKPQGREFDSRWCHLTFSLT
jgi:hypothetical protein